MRALIQHQIISHKSDINHLSCLCWLKNILLFVTILLYIFVVTDYINYYKISKLYTSPTLCFIHYYKYPYVSGYYYSHNLSYVHFNNITVKYNLNNSNKTICWYIPDYKSYNYIEILNDKWSVTPTFINPSDAVYKIIIAIVVISLLLLSTACITIQLGVYCSKILNREIYGIHLY